MDFRQIRYFLEIHRQGSFLRAASNLGLTQPALSQQMALLERELGKKLFWRGPTGAHISSDGERFLHHALELEHILREITESMKTTPGLQGSYTIATGGTIAAFVLPRAMRRILRLHPDVSVRVVEGDAFQTAESVRSGQADLGILSGSFPEGDIQRRFFFTDQILPVVSSTHPLARKRRLSLAGLSDVQFLMYHPAAAMRQSVEHQIRSLGAHFQPRIVMELRSIESVVKGVEEGIGVGFLSRLAISRKMRILPVPELVARRDFYFCYRRISQGIETLMRILGETQTQA